MNSPSTNIIIRTKNIINKQTIGLNDIVVKGSESGIHKGNVVLSDDERTLIFKPFIKFSVGELVSVQLKQGLKDILGDQIGEYSFNFSVSKQSTNLYKNYESSLQKEIKSLNTQEYSPLNKFSYNNMKKINLDSLNLPGDFPQLYFSVLSNPTPGYTFMSNFGLASGISSYLMILDNSGRPVYYKKMSAYCSDFKLQPNGLITYYDSRVPCFYGMDNQFSIVDTFSCSNGYETDLHELQILPNGHYMVIADDYEKVDMSKIVSGGDTSATVTGIIIQEIDKNKNVVFQWRSWDHYKITDATSDIDLTKSAIDYVHTNAIELDKDGNILISNRHMDEITKINRETGDIMWRLGGKNNEFQFINDDIGFSHQHDIRRLPNGDISLFDDGNLHWSQLASRAVEYKLDEVNKTAELVWQFRNNPDETSAAMGNVQRLSNGNSIIGWGTGRPAITEVTPKGLKEFELSLPENEFNYRAFRFNLDSSYFTAFVPTPEFPENDSVVSDTMITLKWKKNKFAQSFHIQLARDSSFTDLILDSTMTDTTLSFDSLEEGAEYYWHMLSNNNTDSIGGYAGYSSASEFKTLLKSPDKFEVKTTSQANFLSWTDVSNNADSLIIERKGGCDTLNYRVIAKIPGDRVYFVDKNPDTLNVISSDYYYRIKAVNQYSYSEYVYSDMVNWNIITNISSDNNKIPSIYSLEQNYPNPFNPSTVISYQIPDKGFVSLKVYDVLGKEITMLVNEEESAGSYKVRFNGNGLPSGIYFYKIQAGNYTSVKKMILIK